MVAWLQRKLPQALLIHPWELLIAGLCLVTGVALAAGAPPPLAIASALPTVLIHVWGAVLALSGAAMLAGLILGYARPRMLGVGLRIERGGLHLLAAASAVFGTAIIVAAGWRGLLPAATYLMFSAACALRTVAIMLTQRGLDRAR